MPDSLLADFTMRNRLVHAYFDIDRNIVWMTVTEELPPLLSQLGTLEPEE